MVYLLVAVVVRVQQEVALLAVQVWQVLLQELL
jgi:hypothetical protein